MSKDSMLNKRRKFYLLFFILMSLLINKTLIAREADGKLPMNIEADRMIINEKKGISRYLGRVSISQGSRKISGDSITVHSKNDKVNKVVIRGKPASFSQLNDNDEQTLASSLEMIYQVDQEILIMKQQAILKQKDNVFKSERITYNTAKDIISAGEQAGTPANNESQRVKITLHPQKDKTEDKTP